MLLWVTSESSMLKELREVKIKQLNIDMVAFTGSLFGDMPEEKPKKTIVRAHKRCRQRNKAEHDSVLSMCRSEQVVPLSVRSKPEKFKILCPWPKSKDIFRKSVATEPAVIRQPHVIVSNTSVTGTKTKHDFGQQFYQLKDCSNASIQKLILTFQ